ncbi:hypothetical protein HHK36_019970 [Tetracentron sinense]|uniref:PGG domain-containing protein n=1 Tax=Tetracentron sinense TaxID=13715 RepID=A0A834YY53_TETSI|nr:hypothetical protein HHK36_019970 [Tetracentron sinense]
MVGYLVHNTGINVSIVNHKGFTALDLVKFHFGNSSDQVVEILQEATMGSSHENNEALQKRRNVIGLLAVLIATVTFDVGMNPPGGVHQETGKAIMGRETPFMVFFFCNNLALFLSLGTIIVLVLVGVIPIRLKSMHNLLMAAHIVVWVSTLFMAAGDIAAMWLIIPAGKGSRWVKVALVSIGGIIFGGIGVMLATYWLRWIETRKRKEKTSEEQSEKKAERPLEERPAEPRPLILQEMAERPLERPAEPRPPIPAYGGYPPKGPVPAPKAPEPAPKPRAHEAPKPAPKPPAPKPAPKAPEPAPKPPERKSYVRKPEPQLEDSDLFDCESSDYFRPF